METRIYDEEENERIRLLYVKLFQERAEQWLREADPGEFCVAPWTHTYLSPQGERRACCASREPAQNFRQYIDTAAGAGEFRPLPLDKWWNGDQLREIRRAWLRRIVPDACVVCDKKLLNTSVYKDYFSHLFGDLREEILDKTDADGYTTMRPISWDYRYSNVCNFRCRMCGDMLSSSWEVEVVRHDMVNWNDPRNSWMQAKNRRAIRQFTHGTAIPEFMAAVEAKTVREIYWVGGEPLLYDEHWTAMRRIIELGYADQVKVRYNTNLSRCHDKHGTLWDLLDHFPHWEICASLDATGDTGEYIRTGLDFNAFIDNFREGQSRQRSSRSMRLDATVTLPGLVSVADICDLADTLGAALLTKVVFAFTPDILLSPLALPREILDPWLDDILSSVRFSYLTQSMREVLENLKTRPTFAEEFPGEYQQAARRGKRHLLKLEAIRPDAKIDMETILSARPEALAWWRSIDAS